MSTDDNPIPRPPNPSIAEWKQIVAPYEEPSVRRAAWQIVDTLGLYVLLWVLMYRSLAVSSWLTLLLAALAGTLLVRVFIIFHDCGHGSFFPSRRANDVTGFIAGMLTFTPYYHWRWEHSLHHATAGDLDRRGTGDVWTMTVQEYLESSRWKRFAYRLARNPIVLFVLAPVFLFVVRQRFPSAKASSRERKSVMWTNLAILGMATALSWLFGLVPYLLIQLTVMMVGGAAGVWLFYVQHQFEDAYWERHEDWNYTAAALQGSSFYKLPKILQWLSGNIGYHHIHHLSVRVPNYNLERCHQSHPLFRGVKAVTLFSSFGATRFRLWDERLRKLVGFRHLKELRRRAKGPEKKDSID
jgi:omega-6 fatty acid desaturase (delta-12 desaturase)